jgi:hypothetical protein
MVDGKRPDFRIGLNRLLINVVCTNLRETQQLCYGIHLLASAPYHSIY